MHTVVALIVGVQGLFGLAFALCLGVLLARRFQLRPFRGRAHATVVSLRPSGSAFVSGVRFTTPSGDELVAEATVPADPNPHRPGDRVRVRYRPDDPRQVRIDLPLSRGTVAMVSFLTLGTILEVVMVATGVLAVAATAS